MMLMMLYHLTPMNAFPLKSLKVLCSVRMRKVWQCFGNQIHFLYFSEEIQNVKIIEPLTDDYDNIDISAQEKLSSKKERVIGIQLENGDLITKETNNNGSSKEKKDDQKRFLEERIIPITLDDGKVMTPLFTKLDELKPPKWSIFHKEGNGKPDSFCSPCTKEEEKEKTKEVDVESTIHSENMK